MAETSLEELESTEDDVSKALCTALDSVAQQDSSDTNVLQYVGRLKEGIVGAFDRRRESYKELGDKLGNRDRLFKYRHRTEDGGQEEGLLVINNGKIVYKSVGKVSGMSASGFNTIEWHKSDLH